MGRRRTISVILTLIGVLLLLIWATVNGGFEKSYHRKVEENYQSISDARDILRLTFLGVDNPPLPESCLEAFLKCPSVIEVAMSFHYGVCGLGLIPRGYPTQIIPEPIEVTTVAVTPDFLRVANIEVVEGRFLNWEDVEKKRMVCVLEDHPNNPYWFGREMKVGDYLYGDYYLDEEGKLTDNPLEIVGLIKTHTIYNWVAKGINWPSGYFPLSVAQEWYQLETGKKIPDYYYYFRVLDNLKAAKEIEEITKLLLGGNDPYNPPVQSITGEGPFRLPPWIERPPHKSYIPFINQALISLNKARWLFYKLPFLFIIISVSGIFLMLLKTRKS